MLAEADIQQCEANLDSAETNIKLCEISSPVDGIVIDRKVDPGQTVVAQFQTPIMFVVAPDLEKKVYVYASVDEADIGLIREAQKRNRPVTFTVDAYPQRRVPGKDRPGAFQSDHRAERRHLHGGGRIAQLGAQAVARNDGQSLLSDREADRRADHSERGVAVLSPARPGLPARPLDSGGHGRRGPGKCHARSHGTTTTGGSQSTPVPGRSPQRYVWVVEDELLSAVPISIGLSDKGFTEIVSGDLREGQRVVTSQQTSSAN